jgi:hypothetical protein
LLGQANNPIEFINSGVLFVNGEFRVADDVEEENVRDLELDLLFNLSGHFDSSRHVRHLPRLSTILSAVEINDCGWRVNAPQNL